MNTKAGAISSGCAARFIAVSLPNFAICFAYLSITGRARVVRDPDKTKMVWRKADGVWWPGGPDDPNVCLLRVEPSRAELWDGPASAAATAFEFAKARLTGQKPKLGENRKVTIAI